jgi:hypothetical protein
MQKKNPITTNILLMIPHEDVDLEVDPLILTSESSEAPPPGQEHEGIPHHHVSEAFGKIDEFSRYASVPNPMKKKVTKLDFDWRIFRIRETYNEESE